jgi:hypothetical protein
LAYSFLGFLQRSAKAGCDDLNCTSLFFYDSNWLKKESSKFLYNNNKNKDFIINYLKKEVCWRRLIFLYLDNKIFDLYNLIKNNLYDLYFFRKNINNNQIIRIINSNKSLEEFKTTIYTILKHTFNNYTIYLLISINDKPFDSEFHITKVYDFNNNSQKTLNNGHKIQNIIKKVPYLLIIDSYYFNYFLFI